MLQRRQKFCGKVPVEFRVTGRAPKGGCTPIQMPPLRSEQLQELEVLYRSAEDGRLRIRALIVLLAADQGRSVPEIARMVRYHPETVRRWLLRYLRGGAAGLHDVPRSGAPLRATAEYREALFGLLRRTPGELGLPFSRWTARRAADHLEVQLGMTVSPASVYRLMRQFGEQDGAIRNRTTSE